MRQAIIVLITLIIGIAIGFATAYTLTASGHYSRHYQVVSAGHSTIFMRINTQTGKTWIWFASPPFQWNEISESKNPFDQPPKDPFESPK